MNEEVVTCQFTEWMRGKRQSGQTLTHGGNVAVPQVLRLRGASMAFPHPQQARESASFTSDSVAIDELLELSEPQFCSSAKWGCSEDSRGKWTQNPRHHACNMLAGGAC